MPDAARNHAPAAGARNLILIDARLSSRSPRYTQSLAKLFRFVFDPFLAGQLSRRFDPIGFPVHRPIAPLLLCAVLTQCQHEPDPVSAKIP